MDKPLLSLAESKALRGIAILGIILHNYCHFLGFAVKENEYTFTLAKPMQLLDRIMTLNHDLLVHVLSFFGHYGVPVFLFISGFGLVCKYEQKTQQKAGALPYIAALDKKGVVTAIGHSDATYDETLAAVNAGASCFVHTYNGQRGLHHRDPGVTGCAMTTPDTYAEVICDGKHVVPAAIKALVDAKGWQHTVLITDCLICGGMPEGEYVSGGMPVIMKDGLCYLKGEDGATGNIAGSVLTLAHGVKNVVDWGIVTAEQAIRMASEVAAKSARVDDKVGYIKPGRNADLTIFNADMTLCDTYVNGISVNA